MAADQQIYLTMEHLPAIARELIRRHHLEMPEKVDTKAVLKLIQSEPTVRPLKFLARGKEKWEDFGDDVAEYLGEHEPALEASYPLLRVYWLAAVSHLVGVCEIKLSPHLPWPQWFAAILGEPWDDWKLDAAMWRAMLHKHWLIQSQVWRKRWEVDFLKKYPDAENYVDILNGSATLWSYWRTVAYANGLSMLEGFWENTALRELSSRQNMADSLKGVRYDDGKSKALARYGRTTRRAD